MSKLEKTAILAVSFLSLVATVAIGPALNGIQNHFLSSSSILIKSVVTLPALICIPVSLLNNKFMNYLSKKTLIMVGLIIYLIGGLSSCFATNIYMLLVTRAILGVGLGIIAPLSLVLIGVFFEGSEKAKFMGYSTAITNLGGIISTLLVGFLAGFSWRASFLVYLIAIIIIILVALFFPKENQNKVQTNIASNKTIETITAENEIVEKTNLHNIESQIKLNKGVFKFAIIVLLALIAFYAIPTNIDFLVKYRNFGGAKLASDIVSLSTFSSLISALLFGKLIKVFKKHYAILIFIVMTIGYIIMGITSNVIVLVFSTILIGFSFGAVIPYTMLFASNIVHKTHTALAITIITTGLYLGEFLSPFILQWISNITKLTSVSGNFFSAGIISVIALLVSIYTAITEKNII